MKRKLLATGIAVIVSIPLIPILEKGIGHLTGSDAPMIFPGRGWSLQKHKAEAPVVPKQIALDLARSASIELVEARGLGGDERIWLMVRPRADGWSSGTRLHNAYEAGGMKFDVFTDADSAGNHFAARGEFGGFYSGWSEPPSVWAGLNWEQGTGNAQYAWTPHLLENLQLFAGGANQHTSWRPSITALSPAAATVGGSSFTLTVNGSGFDNKSIVSWGESGRSAPIVLRLKGSTTIGETLPAAALVNYFAQYQTLAHELMHQRGAASVVSENQGKPPDLTAELNLRPTLTGTALASGLNIGVNTSGGITNWLSPEQRLPYPEDLKTACTAAEQWCAMFITDGKVLSTSLLPGIDLSMYQTLIVEMSGDPGSAQLDNGTETEVTLTVSSNRTASTKDSFAPPPLAEASKNTNKYKFADEGQLPSTGLYYLRARYYNPSGGRFISPDAVLKPAATANNAGDSQDTLARSINQQSQRVAKSGWYALQVGEASAQKGLVELEFVPDNKTGHRFFTLMDSGNGGQEAGLVHIEEPGSVIIRARGREQPALRGTDNAEFMTRWRESTFQRGFLTVTFLNDILPLMAYILVVCLIRAVAYWLIGKLPRAVRARATHEVDLMLAFAKWSGIACYTLWTAKDILAGVGIVLAR